MSEFSSERILKTDYSHSFDEKRKGLAKFEETQNLEYLCDVANYAMFRYMFPQEGDYFRHTDSAESAGIVGMSVKEMEDFRAKNDF